MYIHISTTWQLNVIFLGAKFLQIFASFLHFEEIMNSSVVLTYDSRNLLATEHQMCT